MTNLPAPILEANNYWAIPHSNSENRIWEEISNDYTHLVYNYSDYDFNLLDTKLNQSIISIAIAKKIPEYSSKKILDIAYGICTCPKIKEEDVVLAIQGENVIEKAGIVRHIYHNRSLFLFEIEWLELIKETKLDKPVFDETVELQKITTRMLKNITLPIALNKDKYYELIMDKAIDITSPYLNLTFTNALYNESEKDDKGGSIKLFFGTNRNRVDTTKVNNYYGNELSDLKLGYCTVNIPKGHIQGEIERPEKFLVFRFPEKKGKHIVVEKIEEFGQIEFFKSVANDFDKLSTKVAFIFIHGYNNSFAEAAWRTAQIAWDVPFNGLAGFFSWPSNAKTLAYLKDIELADASIPHFEEFIEKFVTETKVEKLHLIAHSMGNRLLTTTLNNLSTKPSFKNNLAAFQQIVLAAPDIDQDVFNNVILPKLKYVGRNRTLYTSEQDKALHISEKIRGGRPRLGDAGNDLYVSMDIDTIDASNVNSAGNHHSYIFDTRELLADLHLLLNHGFPPLDRRLRARPKNSLTYWLFPR